MQTLNTICKHSLLFLFCSLFYLSAQAESMKLAINQSTTLQRQNLGELKYKIKEYLSIQTKGYPGQVSIHTGSIDPRLKLAACDDVNVTMPRGSRPWGRSTVSVQCLAPRPWTIYVQVSVRVKGQYLVAAAPLAQGQTLTQQDMIYENGDLTQLPAGIYTDASQAVGKMVHISMNAGTVLRKGLIKEMPVIQHGQTVLLETAGQGFSISAEGRAINKATTGQVVKVRVASGQVITGIAQANGRVKVNY